MVRERLYSKMVGLPVVVDENIRPITTIKDLIIDPLNGMVQGFLVDYHKNLVIASGDILSIDAVVHISSEEDIIGGDEVVRIESIQNSGCLFVKNKVFTEEGGYLGKVFDLAIAVSGLKVRSIYVAKDVLGLLQYDHQILGIENIIEVLPDKIVVKNDAATIKDGDEELALEDAYSV